MATNFKHTKMTEAENVKRFLTAGKAIITLESERTGAHFTYRVTKAKDTNDLWFVSLMIGNEQYTYVAFFKDDMVLRTSKKSKLPLTAKPMMAFNYFLNHINDLPKELNVYHACKCGRCGRTLTTPESIQRGIGPECSKMC